MYCLNCETELPDKDMFCWNCGKPQTAGFKVDEVKYEICEIVFSFTLVPKIWGDSKLQLWTKAIESKGVYHPGESDQFIGDLHRSNSSSLSCPSSWRRVKNYL